MDVNGCDSTPEWGYCKAKGCNEPAEPLWFVNDFPDDPDLLLCYKHTGKKFCRVYDALQAIVDIASSPLHWGNEDMQRIIALAKEELESEV